MVSIHFIGFLDFVKFSTLFSNFWGRKIDNHFSGAGDDFEGNRRDKRQANDNSFQNDIAPENMR